MRRVICALIPFLTFFVLSSRRGLAADFSVNPIKLFFGARQKTNVVTVKNNSPDKLTLQITIYQWSQDAETKDVFSPTSDIIAFPKILTIEKDRERLIRVGTRVPPGAFEKTYRIYLEEIPRPQKEPPTETTLRTVMKVGLPVFIEPVKAEAQGKITGAGAEKGELSFSIENSGNIHFLIRGINVSGADASGAAVFQTEMAGWYLHAGRSKKFSFNIPEDICGKIDSLKIDVSTDRLSLTERLNAPAQMCPQ